MISVRNVEVLFLWEKCREYGCCEVGVCAASSNMPKSDFQPAVFFVYLRTKSEFCPIRHSVTGICYRHGKCLLRGTNWGFT
jgi:hypothetical protein